MKVRIAGFFVAGQNVWHKAESALIERASA